jgi:tetratricopeptide (TPR) repeat protein
MKPSSYTWPLVLLSLLCVSVVFGQPQLPVPQPSPAATVSQTIGIAQVQVIYHRPGVKGREVWGKMVPYGEVWRAGANENTSITFSHAARVQGKPVPAGTYGVHMIPTAKEWTLILSTNATSWGSYFYKESEDALRAPLTPVTAEPCEWLQYEFSDLTDTSAVLSVCWEKLRIPIQIGFDTPALVYAHAQNVHLRGPAGFTWQGFNQAAAYCARMNMHLDQALAWVDQSIGLNENFTNLRTKATILEKTGKAPEAAALRERSMTLATEAEINTLGYTYLQGGKNKEAIELFRKNVKDHPESWNVFDSLGEGLAAAGDTKGAIDNYQKALAMVKDAANKKRITDTIAKLKAGN